MAEISLAGSHARAEWACSRLFIEFASCLDRRDYAGVLRLFTPDATFERTDVVMRGTDEISAFLDQRPAHAVTRHLAPTSSST
jgi:hypothetical protein